MFFFPHQYEFKENESTCFRVSYILALSAFACVLLLRVSEWWWMISSWLRFSLHNQRGKSAQGSKVCTERNAIQWRPNVHLSEMQSKTMQCIPDSCITVLIWTLSDVFHLNIRMHFLWSVSSMAGQGVIGVFGHSRWRCISMSTRMYNCTSYGQYAVSGSLSPARVPLEYIFQ